MPSYNPKQAIERRATEIKPIKVTTRTEETDLVWSRDKPSITSLSTENTADLIKSVESIKTEDIEKNLQNLELSAIEPAGSPNSTLKADQTIPQEGIGIFALSLVLAKILRNIKVQ